MIKFTNCRVFIRGKLAREDVWVRDGRIIDPVGNRQLCVGSRR